jgi:hypothetical protein
MAVRCHHQSPPVTEIQNFASSLAAVSAGSAEITLNVISFSYVHSGISKERGLLVMIWKLHYAGIAFTMKMNSDNKIQCGNGI